ncbi:GNAT family N-acetyltransferase [Brevibacillus laterosporus]|uniref:GNAT family N-acetyltransferase n=1 Tax=Brevibacillus laterosporus TaxID=1465 RepID=A0A518VB69_BRELA|nr:GNAT family N-acetyltransferase [Brevibacillus laterosporus]
MIFQKEKVLVRKLVEAHKHWLVKWLTNPVVLEYYEGRDNPHDLNKVMQHYYENNEEVTRCIVEYDWQAIGYLQFYQIDEQMKLDYGYTEKEVVYGTDQFIGEPERWNSGIGRLLVSAMVEYLHKEKGAHKVVMDPQAWNERAIRCYIRCGFKKVKLLPKHERHEGELRDCWLLEHKNHE